MKVKELIERLLQFEQEADLEIMTAPDQQAELGSVYDNTQDSTVYWPPGTAFEKVETRVVIELEPV